MSYRKIPALRGLLWCLDAWRLLKASPQPLFTMTMWLSLGTFLPLLNFFVLVLLTVFYGGVISALHKKAGGEAARPGDFFNGFKSLPRFLGLWLVGVPNIVFAIFASSVLLKALGPDVAQMIAQGGQMPDQALLRAAAPAVLAAAAKLLPIGIVIGWIIFLAVPRVMLDKRPGIGALSDALSALVGNLGAMILFSVGYVAAAMATSVLLAIPLAMIGSAGALAGMLQTFLLVFISTLGWALYLNAMYVAWRDIFMRDAEKTDSENTTPPETQIAV